MGKTNTNTINTFQPAIPYLTIFRSRPGRFNWLTEPPMTFPSEALRNGLAKHGTQMPSKAVWAPKIQPPKKWSFPWAKWSFGRKSQQNLVYRCSLGRCFLKFMLREPDPTISSPPHPHFKAPALSVVQGKVMCCEPQRFVCEKKYQPNLCATLEKRNETWRWGKMQSF